MSTKTNRRGVSIRWSLIRSFLLLILLLAGSIFVLLRVAGARAVDTVAAGIVRRTVDKMEADLAGFFAPVTSNLRIAQDWSAAGALHCRDRGCINQLLAPVMRRYPQIDSVNTGDEAGRGVLLMRTETGWRNRVVDVEAWGTTGRIVELTPDFEPVSESEEEVGYDPRTRPWYRMAKEGPAERVQWTPPYRFFTSKDPGITASVVVDPPGRDAFVLAIDVKLEAISTFTQRLDAGSNGLVFVLSDDGRALGLPRHPDFDSDEERRAATLRTLQDLDLPVVQAASAEAATREFDGPGTFPFEYDDETWWGSVRVFRRPGAPALLLGVLAPESDFLRDLQTMRIWVGAVLLLSVVAAALLGAWLARKYSDPVRNLVHKSERIKGLDLEQLAPASTNVAELLSLDRAQEDMRKALDSFARYVPTDVVRDLIARGEAAQIGGHDVELTVLFTDIAGFTRISEGMTPGDLTRHMAEYFEAMIETLQEHGATVDKLVGDAIVAFWGAPNPQADHAERAMRAVLACEARLADLNVRWEEEGRPALPTRFGLATGPVVVGNIGASSRLAYTVLGDTVNFASRIEGLSKVYGTFVLADEGARDAAGEAFAWRRIDRIIALGKTEPAFLYELLGTVAETPADVREAARRYEAAWDDYAAGEFARAVGLLEALVADGHESAPVSRLLERCRQYETEPPGADWNGVTRMTRK